MSVSSVLLILKVSFQLQCEQKVASLAAFNILSPAGLNKYSRKSINSLLKSQLSIQELLLQSNKTTLIAVGRSHARSCFSRDAHLAAY